MLISIQTQILLILDCSVILNDLKKHAWWGPKIAKITQSWGQYIFHDANERGPVNFRLLQSRADNGIYVTVFNFYLDLLQACKSNRILGPACRQRNAINKLKELCRNTFPLAFPWFDVNRPTTYFDPVTKLENAVKPPYGRLALWDHSYADFSVALKHGPRKVCLLTPNQHTTQSCLTSTKDKRKCQFCGQTGDRSENLAGRLLYFRHNEWVHVNCSLWSAEVYEEVDGSLQNVWQALSRSTKLTCTLCNQRGATIGCNHKFCESNYHFECGLKDGATYKDDKKVFCIRHCDSKSNDRDVPVMKDFQCLRTIHIDAERENKKSAQRKHRLVDLRTVKLRIGSLTVQTLGHLRVPVSDTTKTLIPVNFECTRIFWSTLEPTRKVKYRCHVRLVIPQERLETEERNLVVNHEKVSSEESINKLHDLEKYVKQVNLNEAAIKKRHDNEKLLEQGRPVFTILSPNDKTIKQFGEHLSYKTLHENESPIVVDIESGIESDIEVKIQSNLESNCDSIISEFVQNTPEKENMDCSKIENLDAREKSVSSWEVPSGRMCSPMKPLNKAVSNFINRISPIKNNSGAVKDIVTFPNELNKPLQFNMKEQIGNITDLYIKE